MTRFHCPAPIKKKRLERRFLTFIPIASLLFLASCVAPPGQSRNIGPGDSLSEDRGISKAASINGANGQSRRRVALVIGNSEYSSDIGVLTNPTNDANDMAAALERTGFKVDLLMNASRDEMQRAVLAFDQDLRASDIGLFYYAGHAVQVDGRNFMIPTDASLDITSDRSDAAADYVALETVEIENVLGRMGNAEPDLNIVILDACRNNPFSEGARGISRGLAQTSAPRGTFVAYATSPGKIARDGSGENSPYTAAIVKNLETPGLKLEEMFKRVRQDVALETDGRQIPWENSSVFGDFYFTAPPPKPELKPTVALSRENYTEVQQLLAALDLYQGPVTGTPDERTRDAIIRWQTLHNLDLNGEITKAQLPFLRTDAFRGTIKPDPKIEDQPPTAREPVAPSAPPARKWEENIIIPSPPA